MRGVWCQSLRFWFGIVSRKVISPYISVPYRKCFIMIITWISFVYAWRAFRFLNKSMYIMWIVKYIVSYIHYHRLSKMHSIILDVVQSKKKFLMLLHSTKQKKMCLIFLIINSWAFLSLKGAEFWPAIVYLIIYWFGIIFY